MINIGGVYGAEHTAAKVRVTGTARYKDEPLVLFRFFAETVSAKDWIWFGISKVYDDSVQYGLLEPEFLEKFKELTE